MAISDEDYAWAGDSLPHAMAFAMALARDRALAEDLVHDCYCRLLRKSGDYDLPRDGLRILRRAISNAWIDRRRAHAPTSLDALAASQEDDGGPRDRRTLEPPQEAMLRELESRLEEELSQLPAHQRAALLLKSEGHSLDEIAEALGVSSVNAGVLVHRARKTLTRRLGDSYEERGAARHESTP